MIKTGRSTAIVAILILSIGSFACSSKEAIDSRKLKTSVKMSETIFLDPVEPEQKTVWIHVRNTSDKQDIDPIEVEKLIKAKLEKRGYKVIKSPKRAHYRLQANLLYADHERQSLTEDGMLLGGFGGAVLGGQVGGDSTGKAVGTVVGAVAGAVIGGMAGSAVGVDKHLLVIDINIAEKTPGGVERFHSGELKNGSTRTDQSASSISGYMNYRARVVGTARQTNLDWKDAQPILLDQFASSLAGIF